MQQRLLALVTVLVPGLAYAQPTDAPPVDPATSDVVAEPPAPEAPPVDTQPAPEPAPPAADGHAISAKYDKGLTFETADGEYELKLGIRSQFRLEAARPDVAGTEFATRFSVPRLRLQLEGHAYGEANGYKVEFDMANKGFTLLKDFFIDHAFAKDLHLRAGQWKRPFNRQEMVSDFGSEFLERSLANEFAGAVYPFFRSSALLRHLDGRTRNVPVVLLYPGERRGPTALSFMGVLDPDSDYRPRIYP